jgi:uncharacterized protein
MNVAIVGSGISGLGCAHALTPLLAQGLRLTLFEADSRLGGHTNTVDVTLDGVSYPVDTGFLVFNERTYPNLIRLFDELNVPVAASDMSFALSVDRAAGSSADRLEWAGTSLDTVFGQRRNLLSPRFLRMLADILRFNRVATQVATHGHGELGDLPLGEFLARSRFSRQFEEWYLLPMAAAIWSCPVATMREYPLRTFARFCHNHGLLQVNNRPKWFTVQGGARQYVERIAARLPDVRTGQPVREVRRLAGTGKLAVSTRAGSETFDHVVLACHSSQSLKLLAEPVEAERKVLTDVRYQRNRALLHTDVRLMPETRRLWASWNYLSRPGRNDDAASVSVTYWLNRLQPLPFKQPVLVSLNPLDEPAPGQLIAEFDYEHPVFDAAAVVAQRRLADVQGAGGLWFAGAWTGFGFHEDGLKSGLAAAAAIRSLWQSRERLAA